MKVRIFGKTLWIHRKTQWFAINGNDWKPLICVHYGDNENGRRVFWIPLYCEFKN